MPDDYIPEPIGELVIWGQNFVSYIGVNVLVLAPLTAAVATALSTAYSQMVTAINNNTTAQAAAQAANAAQELAIANFETKTRDVAQQMQASPTVTDQQREAAGLPVYDTIRTAVAPPSTRPTFEIDISDRLRHIIKFRDELTPDTRAKPAGAREAEIWHKVSDTQPVSENDYDYLAGDSATPYVAAFDGAQAGKTVWYLLRWKSTRGETGPWSFPLSAKVPA